MGEPGLKPNASNAQSILEFRTAENSAAYLLPKLQSMKESNPSLELLDVGSGPGAIAICFAKLIPDGQVTAVDLNEKILPQARSMAESTGVTNIKFQQADVYSLPFPDDTFDITHCHQMLTHLKAPWDALREMLRVTKPGGIVAAREGDQESECFWPGLPGLSKFKNLVSHALKAAGGVPTGGRQLLSWALKAGVKPDRITTSYGGWCYRTQAEKNLWGMSSPSNLKATVNDHISNYDSCSPSDGQHYTWWVRKSWARVWTGHAE